jgi:fluoride exporter
MRDVLLIGVAGGLGSLARYGVFTWSVRTLGEAFPWGTLAINVLGSFLLGAVLGLHLAGKLPRSTTLALGTGFCGGFTTFSTFSAEAVALLGKGQAGRAAAYVGASVLLGLLGAWLGFAAMR